MRLNGLRNRNGLPKIIITLSAIVSVLVTILGLQSLRKLRDDRRAFLQVAPADGSVVVVSDEVRFSWKLDPRLERDISKKRVRYDVYVGGSPTDLRRLNIEIFEDFLVIQLPRLLVELDPTGETLRKFTTLRSNVSLNLYWKVSVMVSGEKTYYSDIAKFTLKVNREPLLTPLHPVTGDRTPLLVTLSWRCDDEEPELVKFTVMIGTSPERMEPLSATVENFGDRIFGARLSRDLTLKPRRTYYWRVIAEDPHGSVFESPVNSFSTSEIFVERIVLTREPTKSNRSIVHASPLALTDGTIYVGDLSGRLYSIDSSGTVRWVVNLKSGIWACPVLIGEDELVVATLDGVVYALNSGRLEELTVLPGEVRASPAVRGNHLYLATVLGELYALTRGNDGSWKVAWVFRSGGEIWSSPAIDRRGNVYFGSFDGKLYSVSPAGKLRWAYKTGGRIWSSPAVGPGDVIYFGSDDGYLYALSQSGKLLWRFRTPSYVRSSPAVGPNGEIYVGGWDNSLYAFKPNGELIWRVGLGANVFGSPLVDNYGTIYVGSWDGNFYAILRNGEILWRVNLKKRIDSSPTIGADGRVYFGCDDGNLYRVAPYGTLRTSEGLSYPQVSLARSPWPKFRANVFNTGEVVEEFHIRK